MALPLLGRRQLLASLGLAACSSVGEPSPGSSGSADDAGPAPPASPPQRAVGSSSGQPTGSLPPARRDALGARYPRLASLGVLALGELPTRVQRLDALGTQLGLELWIKRDDESSVLFGGGKVRKLERLLAEARRLGHGELLTFGAVASNHAVATAAFGKQAGFGVTVQLAAQPKSRLAAQHLAACARFGARIEDIGGVSEAHARAVRRHRGKPAASSPYVIAPGGSSELGHLGFADAAFELKDQVTRGELPAPDVIVMAVGTMGSTLGLAFGLRAAGLDARILAVRCSSDSASGPAAFAGAQSAFTRWLRSKDPELDPAGAEVTLEAGFLGGGYAVPSPEGAAAMSLSSKHGLELEATYTAKAFAALCAHAPALAGRRVLFWASHPRPVDIDLATVDERAIPMALRSYLRT